MWRRPSRNLAQPRPIAGTGRYWWETCGVPPPASDPPESCRAAACVPLARQKSQRIARCAGQCAATPRHCLLAERFWAQPPSADSNARRALAPRAKAPAVAPTVVLLAVQTGRYRRPTRSPAPGRPPSTGKTPSGRGEAVWPTALLSSTQASAGAWHTAEPAPARSHPSFAMPDLATALQRPRFVAQPYAIQSPKAADG